MRLATLVAVALSLAGIASLAADSLEIPSLRIERAAPGIRLTWAAQPDHRYRIETAPQLNPTWVAATERIAASSVGSWTDTNAVALASQRFYRLVDLGLATSGALSGDSGFRAADLVPLELSELFDRSGRDALDAIQVATAFAPAGSSAVTHGTLRVTGQPAQPYQYEPLPKDRFVLIPLQGPTVEIHVLFVDLARGISEWRHVSAGSDLVFRNELGAQANLANVKGLYQSTTFPGVTFRVDLAGITTGFSEVDSTGNHTLTDTSLSGRVESTGFTQTVQTRNRFEFISTRGISGRLQSASTSEVWNNNTMVLGGDTYLWNNVKKQRSFRDGKESQLDTYWNATGEITRNGQSFGRYRKTLTPVGTSVIDVRFQVVLADRVVDVEQWTVQVP